MAEVLVDGLGSNPVAELDPTGNVWYANNNAIRDLPAGVKPKEILWRGNKEENVDLERDNYPPTLYGSGRINPTQNLVDAFPMANGYPIGDPSSNYDPNDPYAGRDPRLTTYILINGGTAGPQNTAINTARDAGDNNGLNKTETSTRTGYYMMMLLNRSVTTNPSFKPPVYFYSFFFCYSGLFVVCDGAAKGAGGPRGTGSHVFSAKRKSTRLNPSPVR